MSGQSIRCLPVIPLATILELGSQAAQQQQPVHDELRHKVVERIAHERRGQTPRATALVYEAHLRSWDTESLQDWDGRSHLFVAAGEAIRPILADSARRPVAAGPRSARIGRSRPSEV